MQPYVPGRPLLVLLTSIWLCCTAPLKSADVLSTFLPGSGLWSVNGNWSNAPAAGGFPNNGNAGVGTYDATIGSQNVQLDQNITVQKLTLNSGVISSNFNLTANDLFHWTGGTLQSTGTFNGNGGLLLAGGQKIISSGRILSNPASALWTNGSLVLSTSGTINNSGIFTANSAGALTLSQTFGGTNIFYNDGTYVKSGSGTNNVAVNLHNSGLVDIQAGRMELLAAGDHSGRFQGVGVLEIDGGPHRLLAGSTVNVAQVEFSSGNVTNAGTYAVEGTVIRGGNLQLLAGTSNNTTTFDLASGTLGGAGDLLVAGLLTWTGGTMDSPGTTYANGGIVIGGPNQKILSDGRTLNNPGGALWTNGQIRFFTGGTFNNSGTFTANSAALLGMNLAFGGVNVFNNTGSYIKSGTGTNSTTTLFHNSGLVDVQVGRLELNGGGGSSGRFTGSGTLDFGGGTHNLSGSSTVSVAQVIFSAGTVTNSGRYDVNGGTTASGGTARFLPAASIGSVGTLSVSGGILDLNSGDPINSASLNLSGGTLSGTDNVTISGQTIWTGGTMEGLGTTIADGGMLVGGPDQKILSNGRTLNNPVSALWTNGQIRFFTGATLNNFGSFNAASDAALSINPAFGGVSVLNNPGSYIKSGNGANTVTVLFNNSGTAEVQGGRLELSGGGSSSGRFLGPGTLDFGGGTHVLSIAATVSVAQVVFSGGTVTNSGRYDVNGGTLASGGDARFLPASSVGSVGPLTISAGTLDLNSGDSINSVSLNLSGGILSGSDPLTISGQTVWTGGTMRGPGTTDANGGILFGGPNQKILEDGRVLNTPLSALWTNGQIRFFSGGTINNPGTFTADSAAALLMSPAFGQLSAFNNTGTYLKAGTGSNTVSLNFNNTSLVDVQAGRLELSGGGSSSGRFVGPGTLEFGGGTHVLSSAATVSVAQVIFSGGIVTNNGRYEVGNGTRVSGGTARFTPAASVGSVGPLTISAGTLDLNSGDPVHTSNFNFSSGDLTGADTLTISGQTVWTGGTMGGSGITHAQGGLLLGGSSQQILENGHVLNNTANALWTNGLIRFFNGGTFNNAGSFTANSPAALQMSEAFGNTNAFNNTGTYTKLGSGTNTFTTRFHNTGTVLAQEGVLEFELDGYLQTAGSTVLTGAVILATTPLNLQGGILTGSGTIAGIVTNNATIAPGFGAGSLQIGTLNCRSNSLLNIEIGGTNPSSQYDVINLTNSVILGGTLEVKFINGFQATISSNSVFTILSAANSLSGVFSNVADGQRLYTSDGFGSFRVAYNSASRTVVLSDFEPILPVVANFSANPTNGPVPLNVTFLNLTAGSATNFTWTFGDGFTSTQPNPVHVYTNTGSYTVSLAAGGPGGTNTVTRTNYITVFDAACSLLVVNTDDSGSGSLRAAIACANSNAGTDAILFNIPGAGPHTITPLSALPEITGPTILDGYTQPGSSVNTLADGNNAVLLIEINGVNLTNGLHFSGGGSTVRGLVLNRFNTVDAALVLSGPGGNVVEGNFIGTDTSGTNALPNLTQGILAASLSGNNRIGGTAPANRNVVSGNAGNGIEVQGNSLVLGNFIGTDRSGTASLANSGYGVVAMLGVSNIIGGSLPGSGNLISGNVLGGVRVGGTNLVQGNWIGTDIIGLRPIANGEGVWVQGSDTLVGGVVAGQSNLIRFNVGTGVRVEPFAGGSATNVSVLGNMIFANGLLGIDLVPSGGGAGVTTNDATDLDEGPNHLQNFPVFTSATNWAGWTVLGGTLQSAPSRSYRIEIFGNIFCDTNGYGEGRFFMGSTNITTDVAGSAAFSFAFEGPLFASSFSATATDPEGNTSEFAACISPVTGCQLICPDNIVVAAALNQCGTTVTFADPEAQGACGPVQCSPPSGSFFPVGTTTVSCTTTSGANCSFLVTVLDQQNPTITCSSNLVLSTDPGVCSRSNVVFSVGLADNCPGDQLQLLDGLPSGSTFPKGTTTNRFRVTDTAGNTAMCEFLVTILDTEMPFLECPTNIVRSTDPGQCSASNVTYAARFSDNCPGVVISYAPPSGSTFQKGDTIVTCGVLDAAGNTNSCNFTVTVVDGQPPSIVCPPDIIVSTDAGRCSASNVTYAAVFSDNCPGAVVAYTPPSGSTFQKGTNTVTCVATDAAGNTNSCIFTVTVLDEQPPSIVCPQNIVVSADAGQCSASNVTYAAVFSDNCPGAVVMYTPPSGATFQKGTNIVRCVATDAAGNTNSCTFTVTVLDGQPPSIVCPPDIVVSTDAGHCSASNVTYATTAADNCSGVVLAYNPPSGSLFEKGTNLVTGLATDAAGNTNNCTFRVIVLDSQPPTITCPAPIAVTAAQGATNAVVTFSPGAVDNCPGSVSVLASPASGSLFPLGVTTVNCVATDVAGNTNACSFTVSVSEPDAPREDLVLTKLAAPASVPVGAEITYSLLVSNAGPELAPNVTLIDSLPTLVSFVSAESDFGNCAPAGNNIVCELGSLAEGDTATVTITVIVGAVGTVCNFASVQSQQADLVLSNNTASICTLVTSPPAGADLSVTKMDALDPVTVGGNITYNIRVRNNGPQAATGVVLTDVLPDGLSVVSLPTNSTIAGNIVTCQIGSLNAGASATVSLALSAATAGQVCNTASVAATEVDPVTANNQDVACTEVTETPRNVHDLAVVKITAPPVITLTANKPTSTRYVTVQIQNRSPHDEVISSWSGFGTNLVTLNVESLGICPDLVPVLRSGSPQKALPVILKPKQKLNVIFNVTFSTNCISNAGKSSKTTPGHEDYRYFARVHHQAIDGQADTHPEDDYGPRSANPPFETDPNPDGTIKDTGVGKKKGDKTFGADIVTDVVRK